MSVPKDAGWKDVPKAGRILEPGCVHVPENCINCLLCWVYCPDMSIQVENGRFKGIDYRYCKGCGVCAQVCPGKRGNKALMMLLDEEAQGAEGDTK